MTADVPGNGCDTRDLLVVHRVLRSVFARIPRLVAEAGSDPERHAVIDAHLDEMAHALHSHHEGEDLALWDRLERRRPACALHVTQMRTQHAGIAAQLTRVATAHAGWKVDRAGGADALVGVLVALNDALNTHLADEERFVPEIAPELISQKEWDEMREHGMAGIPRDRLLVQLGFMLREFDTEEERADFWGRVPLGARVMYRLFGARQLSRELTEHYGEAPYTSSTTDRTRPPNMRPHE
ncbi:MAG: hemerythrin domain-containing protein [Microbacterium sp.]